MCQTIVEFMTSIDLVSWIAITVLGFWKLTELVRDIGKPIEAWLDKKTHERYRRLYGLDED